MIKNSAPPLARPGDCSRLGFYAEELRRISPPSTYRERVLQNVYLSLLTEGSLPMENRSASKWGLGEMLHRRRQS